MDPQPATLRKRPTVFFSYARTDASIVRIFAQQLRLAGVEVLLDVEFLKPGERFERAIFDKVSSADAFAFFASPSSLQSAWVEAELLAFGRASSKVIYPILINGASYDDLPDSLTGIQALLVEDESAIPSVADQLARALIAHFSKPGELSPEAQHRATLLAADIAADIRAPAPDEAKVANSVFLVHGHDHTFRDDVDSHLRALGIQSVILSKVPGGSRSLLDKFESLATQARFAIVLMSPDDVGASRRQYEYARGGGKKTLKYRARENVILELGFFYGRLGWDHVFVLQKSADYPWPDFERPSDLDGVVFFKTSAELDWRHELTEKLREAGLLDRQLIENLATPNDKISLSAVILLIP